jgi:hypothetical protein
MIRRSLSVPEIGLIAGTRGALGAGLGLLLAEHMSREQRRAVGWSLLGVGVLTTIPIALQLFHKAEEKVDELGKDDSRPAERLSRIARAAVR